MSNVLLSIAGAISRVVDDDAGVLSICEADAPLCQVGTTVVERDLVKFNECGHRSGSASVALPPHLTDTHGMVLDKDVAQDDKAVRANLYPAGAAISCDRKRGEQGRYRTLSCTYLFYPQPSLGLLARGGKRPCPRPARQKYDCQGLW